MTRYNMWKTEAESEWIFPAAQESLGRRQGGAVHAPHLPSHLPDALQGPIHACLPTGPATATSQQRTATSIRRLTRSEPFWSEHGVGIAKAKRPRTQALDRRFEKYFQWDNWSGREDSNLRPPGPEMYGDRKRHGDGLLQDACFISRLRRWRCDQRSHRNP